MKKTGILTMHRVANYGSFLQAYGLKKIIEKLGYNVEFVDYEYEKSLVEKSKKPIFKKIVDNKNILSFIKKKKISKEFKEAYNNKFMQILNVSPKKNIKPKLDNLIIGSDEVFNCLQPYPVGYSRELFGKGYEDINVISYAGSFGHTKINELKKYKIDKEIGQMLDRFKEISVRDENSFSIVEELTGKTPNLNLDPVLISDYSDETGKEVKLKDYIIVYAYTGRLTNKEEKYIKRFAKKHKKKIISLGFYQKIADLNLVVSPFEVLDYFRQADYVITDTFHGTVFSIKMNTKFCTIIRESNKNKLLYLLTKLKQSARVVSNLEEIDKLYENEINFDETNKIISEETKKSIKYLKDNLR